MQPFDGNDPKQANRQSDSNNTYSGVVDENLVYFTGDVPKKKQNHHRTVAVIIIAVLTVVAAVIALLITFMPRSSTPAPIATTAPATAAATQADSTAAATTAAQATTAPKTTAVPATILPQNLSDEDKLMAFAREIGLLETLQSEADNNMTVAVTAEENILLARYTVDSDSQDEEQREYFDTLDTFFDALSARLDKPVYDMRSNSDVDNAVLQLEVFDKNGVHLYSNIID